MIRVTFWAWSPSLNKGFEIIEDHRSIDDARLRAMALNWTISRVEEV